MLRFAQHDTISARHCRHGFVLDDVIHHPRILIVAPGGMLLAGPLEDQEGVVTAEIDLDRAIEEKHSLDVSGHCARPDIFQLAVDEEPALPNR